MYWRFVCVIFLFCGLSACGGSGGGGGNSTSLNQPSVPGLADLWEGKAEFVEDGVQFGSSFGMHFTSSVWSEGVLYSYFINTSKTGSLFLSSTYLAQSTDGINFSNYGSVLEARPPIERIASFPSVWIEDGTWYMVVEGSPASFAPGLGGIYLATSSDGLTWGPHATPILVPSADWERVNIGTPTIFRDNGKWYVFYHGYDGSRLNVGFASGDDLFALQYGNEHRPVLEIGTDWDSGTIGKRSIIKQDDWYYMVYEGSTPAPAGKDFGFAHWSSGLARSRDLVTWEKYSGNPIFPQTVRGFGYDGPEFIRTPDNILNIYFRNTSGTTSRARLQAK
ncbi:MAG: hypothetical protein PHC51_10040 [bacterium]|nr:hypothetical protein [bacterium]